MNKFFQYFKQIGLGIYNKSKQVFDIFKQKGISLCINLFFLLLCAFVLGTVTLLLIRLGLPNIGILILFGLAIFLVSMIFNANNYYILKDTKNEFKIHFSMFKKDFLSIILNNLFVLFLVFMFLICAFLAGKSLGTLNSVVLAGKLSIFQQLGLHSLNILSLIGIFLFFKYIIVSVFVFVDIYVKNSSINTSFKKICESLRGKYLYVIFHFLPFVLLQFVVEELFGAQSIINIVFS
ncbi:MAG: hypothetical protein PHO23_02085 [Candidatus Pacebacteria bacterium]|nr:hypothetical protein [Candidatus Paceibacterota bacterium]